MGVMTVGVDSSLKMRLLTGVFERFCLSTTLLKPPDDKGGISLVTELIWVAGTLAALLQSRALRKEVIVRFTLLFAELLTQGHTTKFEPSLYRH